MSEYPGASQDPGDIDWDTGQPISTNDSSEGATQWDDVTPAHRTVARSAAFKWVLIGLGALLLVGLIVLAVRFLPDLIAPSPVPTLQAYYEALNNGDYDQAATFYDPRSPGFTGFLLPIVEEAKQLAIAYLGGKTGLAVDVTLNFTNLTYKVLERDREAASVQVTGNWEIGVPTLNLKLPLPYNWTHSLSRYEREWYLLP